MLPKEMTVKPGETEELDDAALDRRIAALARGLGLALGPLPGPGDETPPKGG
jgi:hypothetical protein